jgi:uncharacterized membrane protein
MAELAVPAPSERDHLRHHAEHEHLEPVFGSDWFGALAERLARIFGTPTYIFAQSIVVLLWIIFNGYSILIHFDKYPFILLNLAFSTQAAYAAPLILLAQTRQAERDKAHAEADAKHREELAQEGLRRQELAERGIALLRSLIEQNTLLTQQVEQLAREIHAGQRLPNLTPAAGGDS